MLKNDLYFKRFSLLADLLEHFIFKNVLDSKEHAMTVGQNFLDVIINCDIVDFNKPGVAEAYVILHFLERYLIKLQK